jgi:non-heme chloroperoxidase
MGERPSSRSRPSRRDVLSGVAAGGLLATLPCSLSATGAKSADQKGRRRTGVVSANDGAQIFYKDWGSGPPVVLSHGWPLNADSWDDQMIFLASRGVRCIAFDRRGHGRSSQSWTGNDYDTFAEDLKALMDQLDLRNTTLSGHSAGAGDVARYVGRYGTGRVAKVVLVSSIPPLMLRTSANPGGVPLEVFDGIRSGLLKDRAQLYREIGDGPFYGANRPGSNVSQGTKDAFWLWCMQVSLRAAYEGVRAFSETDFTQDLKRFDVPTLIIHGEDDQNVPIANSAVRSAKLIQNASLKIYEQAPHGLFVTHKERFNADLWNFVDRAA